MRKCKANDVSGTRIVVGSIVTIVGDASLKNFQGLVMDVASKHETEDGPIAVFFDKEVVPFKFTNWMDVERWKGEPPTAENYTECPRIVCFLPHEVRIDKKWSSETMAGRTFGNDIMKNWHSLFTPKEPLVSDAHLCYLEDCKSGLLAVRSAFINAFGTVLEVYVCEPCYVSTHGMCCDAVYLKNPLPQSVAA